MARITPRLTKTEKDILDFLWEYGRPLSASEIVDLCPNRNWKASYIYLVLQSMLKKKVIRIEGFRPTVKNYARTFSPTISREALLVHEMVRDLQFNKENIRNLLVYLVDSASALETITSMLELCESKKRRLKAEETATTNLYTNEISIKPNTKEESPI